MKHHKFNISEESFLQGMKSRSTRKGGKKAKLIEEQTQGSLKQLITPYLQNLEVHNYSTNTIKSKKKI